MADFINTIDVLGDNAVIDSIIDRSITEFKDNTITRIGERAFYSCAALVIIDIPNVSEIDISAFYGCTSLREIKLQLIANIKHESASGTGCFANCTSMLKADFSALTSIGGRAFRDCRSLTALILRSEEMCALTHTNSLDNTPIAKGTGYIYVPRALVDSYKAATNWSTYASRFRALEDYTLDGTITGELDDSKI